MSGSRRQPKDSSLRKSIAKNTTPTTTHTNILPTGTRRHCHVCRSPKDVSKIVACASGKRSHIFCSSCVDRRLGVSFAVVCADRNWICPKCRDCCPCSKCRKKFPLQQNNSTASTASPSTPIATPTPATPTPSTPTLTARPTQQTQHAVESSPSPPLESSSPPSPILTDDPHAAAMTLLTIKHSPYSHGMAGPTRVHFIDPQPLPQPRHVVRPPLPATPSPSLIASLSLSSPCCVAESPLQSLDSDNSFELGLGRPVSVATTASGHVSPKPKGSLRLYTQQTANALLHTNSVPKIETDDTHATAHSTTTSTTVSTASVESPPSAN